MMKAVGVPSRGAKGADTSSPQKHLNLEKLGKFLSNFTKTRAIFAQVNEKSGNLYSLIG